MDEIYSRAQATKDAAERKAREVAYKARKQAVGLPGSGSVLAAAALRQELATSTTRLYPSVFSVRRFW